MKYGEIRKRGPMIIYDIFKWTFQPQEPRRSLETNQVNYVGLDPEIGTDHILNAMSIDDCHSCLQGFHIRDFVGLGDS